MTTLSFQSQERPRQFAGVKLAVALGVIITTVLMPLRMHLWFWAVGGLLLLAGLVTRLPWIAWLKRLLWLSPFVAAVALTNTWQTGNHLSWPAVAVRSGLCLTTIMVLIHTTPFSAIVQTLEKWRIPNLLVTTIVLMQRYLFVLSDEALRMRRARRSRTFDQRRRLEWESLSAVVGQLFLRASDRAERIYQAMCARGWK